MNCARVLVLDPIQDSREAIRHGLRGIHLQLSFAPDEASALIMLRASESHVLVTGLDLCEREGRQFLLAVKSSQPSLRVIALTNEGSAEAARPLELARRLGADAAFTRPIPLLTFRETLRDLVRGAVR